MFVVSIIKDFFTNVPLICGILGVIFAQMTKLVVDKKLYQNANAKQFFRTGGMPSSHMCGTSSVFMSIGLSKGFDSPWFAICFMVCAIVMTDAKGVRNEAGKHAAYLNTIKEERAKLAQNGKTEYFNTALGHTKKQVLVGMGLGAIIGTLFTIIFYCCGIGEIKYF